MARLEKISGLLFVFMFDRQATWGLAHHITSQALARRVWPELLCTCMRVRPPCIFGNATALLPDNLAWCVRSPGAGGVSRDRQIGSLLFPRNLRTFDATSPAHSPSPMGNFLVSRGRARTTNSRVDSTEQREPLWPLSRPPVLPSVHVKICLSHPMKRDPSRK